MTHALIVDDSRLACKVLADMLQPLQISSNSVYSAEDALQHLQSHSPDLIFLDHTMKGMDGLETLQVIKSNPKTATIPVLMYTAQQGEVYVGQARALGAVDVLPKGLEKDYLHHALKKLGILSKEVADTSNTESDSAMSDSALSDSSKLDTRTKANPQFAVKTPTIQASDLQDVKDNGNSIDLKGSWREFWQQTMEPYLHRQKAEQTEDVIQFGKQQTRYMNREMHRTLEKFEHALVLRLESHDDFLEAKRALIAERRRWWFIAGIVGILLIQLLLFWQIRQVESSNQQLLVQQQKINEHQIEIDQQLANSQKLPVKRQQNLEPAKSRKQSITLQNLQREALAEIYPANSGTAEYRGVTSTGYSFFINKAGVISSIGRDQFYLTENCLGDIFVDATPGQIFNESDGNLWFIDKIAEEVVVNVNSKMTTDGQCLPLADELKTLYHLQRNISLETGIDEQDTLRLSIN